MKSYGRFVFNEKTQVLNPSEMKHTGGKKERMLVCDCIYGGYVSPPGGICNDDEICKLACPLGMHRGCVPG